MSARPQRARHSTAKATTSYFEPTDDPVQSGAPDESGEESGDEAIIPHDDEDSEDDDFTGKRVYKRLRAAPAEPGAPAPKRTRGPGKHNKPKASSAPVAKKRRKGGRLGRLEAVLDRLPVEILSEILSHVQPVTLLRLSRTAKIFRRLLLSKTSRGIWKRAFANEGIGEFKAGDWSEPQWAALILDKECAMCGRLKVHRIDYEYRARYCDKCTRDSASELHPDLHPDVWRSTLATNTTPSWLTGRAGDIYIESTLLATSAELFVLAREDLLEPLVNGMSRVAAFVEEKERIIPLIKEDAEMLSAWQRRREEDKSKEKRTLRTERVQGIRQKCLDAGYSERVVTDALRPHDPCDIYSLVDQPYPLTDRVWRKISIPIFAQLDALRAVEHALNNPVGEAGRTVAGDGRPDNDRENELRDRSRFMQAMRQNAAQMMLDDDDDDEAERDLEIGGSGAQVGAGGSSSSVGGVVDDDASPEDTAFGTQSDF